MYTADQQHPFPDEQKHKSHHIPNVSRKLEQISNNDETQRQNMNLSLTTPVTPFLQKHNGIAELYYKKYGHICNRHMAALVPDNLLSPVYRQAKNPDMSYKQYQYIKSPESPQKSIALEKPDNSLFLHKAHKIIEVPAIRMKSPVADILLLEKIVRTSKALKENTKPAIIKNHKPQTVQNTTGDKEIQNHSKNQNNKNIGNVKKRQNDSITSSKKIKLNNNSKTTHPEGHDEKKTQNGSNTKHMKNLENSLPKKESGNHDSSKNVLKTLPAKEQNKLNQQQLKTTQKTKNVLKTDTIVNDNVKQDKKNKANLTQKEKQDSQISANSSKNMKNSLKKGNVPNKQNVSSKNAQNTKTTENNQSATTNKSNNLDGQNQSESKGRREGSTDSSGGHNDNDQITEIFKCDDVKLIGSGENLTDNTSLEKVTKDLTTIIKNLQKQIQEVPINKGQNMDEIPSAFIQPKNKEFFKRPKQEEKHKSTKPKSALKHKSQPESKSAPNSRQNSISSILTNSSLKSCSHSRASSPSGTSVSSARKFVVQTNNTLLSNSSSSTSSRKFIAGSNSQTIDSIRALKEDVQRAIRAHKTFTVVGAFRPIRNALRQRGWVEKFHTSYNNLLSNEQKRYTYYTVNELVPFIKKEDIGDLCKNLIKSKLLGRYQVDFYWGISDQAFKENPDNVKFTIINKLKRDIFSYTNKQGLCDASKESYWFQKRDVSKLNHPRSYSLIAKKGDLNGFIEDFRTTAAMSLLKWIVKTNITKESKLISPSGKVPLEAFDFALNECCKFIKRQNHEDIDITIPKATELEWNTFLEYFYKIVHYSNHFTEEKKETEESLVSKSNFIINTLREVWPYVDMDGLMNIWILKPIASSRGRGIHLCRTLQYALKIIQENNRRGYVIQKYIERPLLIHNTKFDIRQWFLISNCSPLTIWMYKDSYLRFSSQTYNLRKLHESIHLTNNSVQSKYKNTPIDSVLPSYNMWDSNEFKRYLANIGYPQVFEKTIYPGMKQSITAAVLMHQDKMIIRRNCFELYGADFMLTEDFQPWLLEINSNPALYGSTPVTSRMCPKVLEDVIKVIVDYTHNFKASTGAFEMIYKEKKMELPSAPSFEVKGVPLRRSYFNASPDEEKQHYAQKYVRPILPDNQTNLKSFTEEIKKTLKNLLQIIHEERRKRECSKKDKCHAPLPAKMENKQIKA